MKISLLQLNMWAGTHFSAIKTFLEHNSFDILCFQEVTGIGTQSGNISSAGDYYQELQKLLGLTHNSELFISQYTTSAPETGYFGNAIFYRKEFLLRNKDYLWLFKRETPFPSDATSYEEVGRNALHLSLEKGGKTIDIITTHLAWAKSKDEHPYQREQNLKLIAYMQHMQAPWILTGDFNIAPDQPSILDLGKLGRNLTKEHDVPNTIDGTIHVSWDVLKPGFPIDYIFVSPDIQIDSFKALDTIHMSDHIGLAAEVEI